jgi:hypothetical protein
MKKPFVVPIFSRGELEFRYDDNEVCIYGTADGLKKLAELCLLLVKNGTEGAHVHIEDYDVLTKKSLKGTIAFFQKG